MTVVFAVGGGGGRRGWGAISNDKKGVAFVTVLVLWYFTYEYVQYVQINRFSQYLSENVYDKCSF